MLGGGVIGWLGGIIISGMILISISVNQSVDYHLNKSAKGAALLKYRFRHHSPHHAPSPPPWLHLSQTPQLPQVRWSYTSGSLEMTP